MMKKIRQEKLIMKTIYKCFPEGRRKVLTMSFDDGKITDRKLIQIFNKNDIKGTFNINSGLFGIDDGFGMRIPENEIAETYRGFEIAVHTSTHPTLPRCPREQIALQILEDRRMLERITGSTVRGMAYPNVDGFNDQIKQLLPLLGIDYARTSGSTMNFLIPKDFHQWESTCNYKNDLLKLGGEFNALYKDQYLYMMNVYGHSIDFENDNCWRLIEDFCSLVGKRDDVWYASNIEIVDYFKALDGLRFSVDGDFVENPSAQTCWISVDGSILKLDGGLTVRL